MVCIGESERVVIYFNRTQRTEPLCCRSKDGTVFDAVRHHRSIISLEHLHLGWLASKTSHKTQGPTDNLRFFSNKTIFYANFLTWAVDFPPLHVNIYCQTFTMQLSIFFFSFFFLLWAVEWYKALSGQATYVYFHHCSDIFCFALFCRLWTYNHFHFFIPILEPNNFTIFGYVYGSRKSSFFHWHEWNTS